MIEMSCEIYCAGEFSSVDGPPGGPEARCETSAVFSFLYLKKLKFQKYMSVLENFKNIPRSPYGGRQGSNVFFFFKFATKSLEKKKEGACRPPPTGHRPLSPTPVATGSPVSTLQTIASVLFFRKYYSEIA